MDSKRKSRRQLNRKFFRTLILFLIVLAAAGIAAFAWYVNNTREFTTDVNMAAGTGESVYISKEYDRGYSSAVEMKTYIGKLTPVSTDRITGGFQRAKDFERRGNSKNDLYAKTFEPAKSSDYYSTSLYLRSNSDEADVYVSDIGFTDADSSRPVSTAVRVGLAVHQAGKDKLVSEEFIFEISSGNNPMAMYNTATGRDGYVIDSSRTDGATVPFRQLTESNYCIYSSESGETTLRPDSRKIVTLSGNDGKMGTPVQIDVYIWLEGCDSDCTSNLADSRLENIAISFACSR
ncbi:MAG: hypothetical protein PUB75_01660 [Firmicutes bacterium]|nr:hypothetical protein [Bacillota bacterium]